MIMLISLERSNQSDDDEKNDIPNENHDIMSKPHKPSILKYGSDFKLSATIPVNF